MDVAVNRSVFQGDVQTAVGITGRVDAGSAGTVEQYGEAGTVAEVAVKVAVVLTGDFESDFHAGDGANRGRHRSDIAHARGIAVGDLTVTGEGVRFNRRRRLDCGRQYGEQQPEE